ncbi:glutathione S-transferase [Bradyrhizobium sp. AZCC 1610]|uniref:glutathione S-transferase N-terminal domain-containing protein n=1 Tax=Bradyrhizobium sp. AZCC 1610 TaxID=3117020 RepID=UPI002FF258B1
MKFFSFWRSLASFRVRIALNLKNVPVDVVFVDLDANAHRDLEYRRINPQMALPALVEDDGTTLFQSLAILEYLDEKYPAPPLHLHGRPRHRRAEPADRPCGMADGDAHFRNRDGAAGICKSASAGAAGHAGGDAAEGLKARLAARRRESPDAPHPA